MKRTKKKKIKEEKITTFFFTLFPLGRLPFLPRTQFSLFFFSSVPPLLSLKATPFSFLFGQNGVRIWWKGVGNWLHEVQTGGMGTVGQECPLVLFFTRFIAPIPCHLLTFILKTQCQPKMMSKIVVACWKKPKLCMGNEQQGVPSTWGRTEAMPFAWVAHS